MQFYIIPKDEHLEHGGHKYVMKEWKNGRWHYYYYKKEGKSNGVVYSKVSGDPNSKYGVYKHTGSGARTNVVSKGDKLFTSRTTTIKGTTKVTNIQVGKLQQAVDAGKSFLDKLFKKKKKVVVNNSYTKRYR